MLVPESLHWNRNRSNFALYQEHQKLDQCCLAWVAADCMNVVRAFIKCLSRTERDRLLAPYIHNDSAFQNVDESGCSACVE